MIGGDDIPLCGPHNIVLENELCGSRVIAVMVDPDSTLPEAKDATTSF